MIGTASVYQATSLETLAEFTAAELRQAPRRIALWRLARLDELLREIEELRVSGEHAIPDDLRRRIAVFAGWQDAQLAEEMRDTGTADLNRVHDALFDAQERVMSNLAELGRKRKRQDIERLFTSAA